MSVFVDSWYADPAIPASGLEQLGDSVALGPHPLNLNTFPENVFPDKWLPLMSMPFLP